MAKGYASIGMAMPSSFDEGPEVDQRLTPQAIKAMHEALDLITGIENRLNAISENMLGTALVDNNKVVMGACPTGEANMALHWARAVVERLNDLGPVLNSLERL